MVFFHVQTADARERGAVAGVVGWGDAVKSINAGFDHVFKIFGVADAEQVSWFFIR